MARGFRLNSGIAKMLVPVAVVGAVGFLAWYLGINPSTRVFNLFGFLAPPAVAAPINPATAMQEGIPVTRQSPNTTGDSGVGFQTFAGATEEGDLGSISEDEYDKIQVSS